MDQGTESSFCLLPQFPFLVHRTFLILTQPIHYSDTRKQALFVLVLDTHYMLSLLVPLSSNILTISLNLPFGRCAVFPTRL